MVFQITKENKRAITWGMYLSGPLWIIIILCILLFMPGKGDWVGVLIGLFFFIIDIGPAVYLCNEYLMFNRGAKFEIHADEGTFKYHTKNGEVIESTYKDIKQIDVYLPPNRYRSGGFQFISMEAFLYARFTLDDGRKFYVTCLMIPRLKDFIKNNFSAVPVKFHRWWIFASIRLCNSFRKKSHNKKEKTVLL